MFESSLGCLNVSGLVFFAVPSTKFFCGLYPCLCFMLFFLVNRVVSLSLHLSLVFIHDKAIAVSDNKIRI